ncbi:MULTISPECIES: PadR family transcriptional regulator [unclassified Rathayibacter]|uniref:PadR family transcriptional regulator n=1 Tax=unclassified Rathayibacter TaxID=2609250 RepID=UPI000CE91C93|nr:MULTISPECIES: PadR family transcriptional regulator [unclassified Rathayibacter]PPF10341.1 PadR family transcriptional regulator [Rathayibacter sp. AY1A5]PPF47850.1 PadR family transcriptional regulator [Rathayibacter sp. AY1A1]PPG37652.1 PadR family transcriptional regulator [Rathayibacter sp. AY2B5]PPG83403.1 PadR family transcriptional regulator [Rathayibacter sp. AY1H2]PPG98441.1 PadR family transcriptional regulator [Rathayibacter sp. AY1G9]
MSPVFAHGRLRLYLLNLLAESPRHGYELIQALSERFGGTYAPSAGTVYPRLAKLEEEGLVTKEADGRKTVYSITDAGRAELANRATDLGDIEEELTDSVRRLADEVRLGVAEAMKSLRADLASAARDSREPGRRPEHSAEEPRPQDTSGTPSEQPAPEQTAPEQTAPVSPDARTASRIALRDAEVLLTEFRDELRAELRTAASSGSVTTASVDALRAALDEARASVRSTLG